MKPILIVTCKAGNEEWCENEIGNILFPYDPDIKVVRTKYSGLLLVYSYKLDPNKAYRIAKSYEYGFVKNIIPVNYYTRDMNELLSYIRSSISKVKKIKLKVRVRGQRNLAKILWSKIIEVLRQLGISHDPGAQYVLDVEVIDEYFYVGFISR